MHDDDNIFAPSHVLPLSHTGAVSSFCLFPPRDRYGLEGAVNVQGEDVKKLDIVANDNFINTLKV